MKRVSTPLILIIRASVEERVSLSKTPKPRLGSKATSGSDGSRLLGWDVEPDEAHWCPAVFVCHLPDEVVLSPIFLTRPRSRAPEGSDRFQWHPCCWWAAVSIYDFISQY